MIIRRWAWLLGAWMLLGSPAWAASGTAENLDFQLTVDAIEWTSAGFLVKAKIENRTGTPDLFLHHAANRDDAEEFRYDPTGKPKVGGPRDTFSLTGLSSSRYSASLVFGLPSDQEPGLLVAGENRPPYRQVAIALKGLLPARPAPAPKPVAAVAPADLARARSPASGEDALTAADLVPVDDPDVIQRFLPPHPSFGDSLVLKEGQPGSTGEGWSRIYTELPDVSLVQLKRVLEQPAQIWQGAEGFLYLKNIGGRRALGVEVRSERVISARYVTPETLARVVGPRTRFPKRVYMGRP